MMPTRIMQRAPLASRVLLWLVCCPLPFSVMQASGSEAAAPPQPSAIQYREVYVPPHRLPEFVDGYIPMHRDDFARLVQASGDLPPQFLRAVFQADVQDNDLINGLARLSLAANTRFPPDATDGSRVLRFDCNLPMQNPTWVAGTERRPALAGQTGDSPEVLVQPDGKTLEFRWSLRGQRRADRTTFHLLLPPALIHQVRLRLPLDRTLIADHGTVSRQDADDQSSLWTIELGGHRELNITIESASDRDAAAKASVAIAAVCRVNPEGLDFTFQLEVVGTGQFAALTLDLDDGLTVTQLAMDGSETRWFRAGGSGESIQVAIPRGDRPASLNLQLRAKAPLVLGELFSVPRIRLRNTQWASESIQVLVSDALEVADVRLQNCYCSQVAPSEQPAGESYAFELGGESSSLALMIDQPLPDVGAECVYLVELDEQTAQAKALLRLHPSRGELFGVEAEVGPGWIVRSVERVGDALDVAAVLDDWNDTQLNIRLNQPASWQTPVTLRIMLEGNLRLIGRSAAVHELVPLKLAGAAPPGWLALRAAPSFKLVARNVGQGSWQQARDLPEWLTDLGESLDYDMFVKADVDSSDAQIGIQATDAPLELASHTAIELSESALRISSVISVYPLVNQIDGFTVGFTQPLPEGTTWSLNGSQEGLVARRLEARDDPSVDQYRVELTTARSRPFEVVITSDFATLNEWGIPLPTSNSPSTRQSTVSMSGLGGTAISIVRREGLQPMPQAPRRDSFETHDPQLVLRYEGDAGVLPDLAIARVQERDHRPCWAWRSDLRSCYPARGRPRHRATFYLQNEGARKLEVRLPVGCNLEQVEINGQPLKPLASGNTRLLLSIPLPEAHSFPCVTIEYLGRQRSLAAIDWIIPPLPETDLRVLQQTWQAWLPSGFRVYSAHDARSDDWYGRLFGPFARPPNQSGRQLTRSLRERFRVGNAADSASRAQQFTTQMGVSHVAGREATDELPADTWGGRLARIEASFQRGSPGFRLLVDRIEMRDQGIFADAPIPSSREQQPTRIGLDRLKIAGLGLLAQENQLLLTSMEELRDHADSQSWISEIAVELDPQWSATPRAMTANDWARDNSRELWRPSSDDLEAGLRNAGWYSHRQPIIGHRPSLKIYRADTVTAMSSSMFFLSAALGWYLARRRRGGWCWFTTGGMVATLLLSQPGAVLAVSVVWGSVTAGLLHLMVNAGAAWEPRLVRPSKMTRAASVLLATSMFCAIPEEASAQDRSSPRQAPTSEDLPDSAAADNPVYSVVIPSEDKVPSGNVVYLPREMYERIRKDSTAGQRGYLFTDCVYQGAWPRLADEEPPQLLARYGVTTLRASVEVPLPAFGPGVEYALDTLRLDRQPVNVAQRGEARSVIIPRAGDHTLIMELRPALRRRLNSQWLRFPIPKIARSAVQLTFPREVQTLRLPTAVGRTEIDLELGTLVSELGPVTELFVEGQHLTADERIEQEVDQLILLELVNTQSPFQWRIETKFRFSESRVPLRLRVDQRLRLVPTPGVVRIPDDEINNRTDAYEIVLAVTEDQHLSSAQFTYTLDSVIGRFTLPEIEVMDLPLRQRWLAIAAPNLEINPVAEIVTSVPLQQFITAWEAEADTPDEVLGLTPHAPVAFDVRPLTKPTTWASTTSFSFSHDGATFQMDCELEAAQRVTIQRLAVPRPLRISGVTATSNGVPRRLRWKLNADGNLLVFFVDDPSKLINLRIAGALNAFRLEEEIELPLIVPESRELATHTVRLYESSDATVEPVRQQGFTLDTEEMANDQGVLSAPWRRLVGVWTRSTFGTETNATPLVVRVHSKQRKIQGHLTTKLSKDGFGWMATVDLDLKAEAGRIDVIRLEVPAELTAVKPVVEVFSVEGNSPAAIAEPSILPAPLAGRRIIAVWPEAAARSCFLRLRLRIAIGKGVVSLPNINLLDVDQVVHEILLPSQSVVAEQTLSSVPSVEQNSQPEQSTYAWSTIGLEEQTESRGVAAEDGYNLYRVNLASYAAELRRVVAKDKKPQVHMVRTDLHWESTREFVGLSTFDLQPANLSQCVLRLPPRCRLIQVLIDEKRTTAWRVMPLDGDSTPLPTWQVELATAPWPQRLRVLFEGECDVNNNGQLTIFAPRLSDDGGNPIPYALECREFWSVYAPEDAGEGVPLVNNESSRDRREMQLATLEAYNALLDDAKLLVGDRPRQEKSVWCDPWARRAESVIRDLSQADPADDHPEMRQLNKLESEFRMNVSEYLGASGAADPASAETVVLDQQQLWRESQWFRGPMLHCMTNKSGSSLPELVVDYPRFSRATAHARYALAVIVAWLALVLPRWRQLRPFAEWLLANPQVAGVGLGIAWCCCLSPRWPGLLLVIIVIAVWLYGRFGQRQLVLPTRR